MLAHFWASRAELAHFWDVSGHILGRFVGSYFRTLWVILLDVLGHVLGRFGLYFGTFWVICGDF